MEEQRKLPVNVRQVGSADPAYTVYVEDYVETYIRKQKYTEKKPVVAGYLYGKILLVEGEMKCLVTGAAEDGRLSKDRGRDRGRKYFPEEQLVGWFIKGEKDKLPDAEEQNRLTERLGLPEGAVLYIGDGEDSALLNLRGRTLFPLSGHMIFYERNEAMQEYMIGTGDGKSIESETVDQAAVHFREVMQKKEEPEVRKKKEGAAFYKAAAFAAMLLLGGSLIIAGNDSLRQEAFSWIHELAAPEETEPDIPVNVMEGNVEPTECQPEPAETFPPETQPEEPGSEPDSVETVPPETEPAVEIPSENPGIRHVVSVGETLNGILKRYYGEESRLNEICSLNQIENPDEIFEGQVIHLP